MAALLGRTLVAVSVSVFCSHAYGEISLSSDLWSPLGVTAVLQGSGRAHVSDSSAADNNPAGLAMQRSYTIAGDIGWVGSKGYQAEASACDSTTSELAACIKFRQTQKVSGARDRRYTLGLAEAFEPLWGVIIGLGVDYVEFSGERQSFAIPAGAKTSGQRLRVGVLQSISDGIFIGATSEGLYDSTGTERRHGVGVSAKLGSYYLFNGDLDFSAMVELVRSLPSLERLAVGFHTFSGVDGEGARRVCAHGVLDGVVEAEAQRRVRGLAQPRRIDALPEGRHALLRSDHFHRAADAERRVVAAAACLSASSADLNRSRERRTYQLDKSSIKLSKARVA